MKVATTHTGALAGSDAAADAFLRAIGIVRVDQIETLLELPPLLLGRTPPVAPKRAVSIVTTTGGGGAMVVDRLGIAGIGTAHMLDTTLAGASKDFVAKALDTARDAEWNYTISPRAPIWSGSFWASPQHINGLFQAIANLKHVCNSVCEA